MRSLLFAILALSITACGGSKATQAETTPAPTMPDKPLFERLGGLPAIAAVVDDFLANVGADARINQRFANTDLGHLKKLLVDQICMATGGPCTYTGRNMVDAHTGMGITDEEFGALVEDLVKTLNKLNVPEKEQGELLSALGGMKGDIVER
jgi:hemoglobin